MRFSEYQRQEQVQGVGGLPFQKHPMPSLTDPLGKIGEMELQIGERDRQAYQATAASGMLVKLGELRQNIKNRINAGQYNSLQDIQDEYNQKFQEELDQYNAGQIRDIMPHLQQQKGLFALDIEGDFHDYVGKKTLSDFLEAQKSTVAQATKPDMDELSAENYVQSSLAAIEHMPADYVPEQTKRALRSAIKDKVFGTRFENDLNDPRQDPAAVLGKIEKYDLSPEIKEALRDKATQEIRNRQKTDTFLGLWGRIRAAEDNNSIGLDTLIGDIEKTKNALPPESINALLEHVHSIQGNRLEEAKGWNAAGIENKVVELVKKGSTNEAQELLNTNKGILGAQRYFSMNHFINAGKLDQFEQDQRVIRTTKEQQFIEQLKTDPDLQKLGLEEVQKMTVDKIRAKEFNENAIYQVYNAWNVIHDAVVKNQNALTYWHEGANLGISEEGKTIADRIYTQLVDPNSKIPDGARPADPVKAVESIFQQNRVIPPMAIKQIETAAAGNNIQEIDAWGPLVFRLAENNPVEFDKLPKKSALLIREYQRRVNDAVNPLSQGQKIDVWKETNESVMDPDDINNPRFKLAKEVVKKAEKYFSSTFGDPKRGYIPNNMYLTWENEVRKYFLTHGNEEYAKQDAAQSLMKTYSQEGPGEQKDWVYHGPGTRGVDLKDFWKDIDKDLREWGYTVFPPEYQVGEMNRPEAFGAQAKDYYMPISLIVDLNTLDQFYPDYWVVDSRTHAAVFPNGKFYKLTGEELRKMSEQQQAQYEQEAYQEYRDEKAFMNFDKYRTEMLQLK